MDSKALREKFLKFFEDYKGLEHKVIPSASLIPSEEQQLEGKEKVLFTTAGMQPLIPYLTGKEEPPSKRLVNCQKCLRTDDIDEVGDDTHHTFFEMLGNWSIGDYWKKEAIEMSFKFLTEELKIPIGKLAVSAFAGDDDAPRDDESADAWKSLGIPDQRIAYLGKEDNWWPTSRRDEKGNLKNAFGPCGPDTEMFYWTGDEDVPKDFDPKDTGWVEIWNDVFMQFDRKDDGTLEDLPQRNVDTGMGLERTVAVLNGKKSAYETDLFLPIIKEISKSFNTEDSRIVADHIKAAIFLINEGVEPSNKEQGYVLRRLLRRATTKAYLVDKNLDSQFFKSLVKIVMHIYPEYFKGVDSVIIEDKISLEIRKFRASIEKGFNEIAKIEKIDGKKAFDLYQSFGFPLEITEELFEQKGQKIDHNQFEEEFEKHQELSRTASSGMFKGGLAGHSEVETKYHTATHLLHQALRDVLGAEVFQKGSNINQERLRFDFSFDRKVDPEELEKVEEIINDRIKQDLKVDRKFMSVEEAKKMNAIGLFNDKYAESVSIYGVGPGFELDPEAKDQRYRGGYYSAEFCGGPHVEHTGEIGGIKIKKEEAVSAGVRRIYAELV